MQCLVLLVQTLDLSSELLDVCFEATYFDLSAAEPLVDFPETLHRLGSHRLSPLERFLARGDRQRPGALVSNAEWSIVAAIELERVETRRGQQLAQSRFVQHPHFERGSGSAVKDQVAENLQFALCRAIHEHGTALQLGNGGIGELGIVFD